MKNRIKFKSLLLLLPTAILSTASAASLVACNSSSKDKDASTTKTEKDSATSSIETINRKLDQIKTAQENLSRKLSENVESLDYKIIKPLNDKITELEKEKLQLFKLIFTEQVQKDLGLLKSDGKSNVNFVLESGKIVAKFITEDRKLEYFTADALLDGNGAAKSVDSSNFLQHVLGLQKDKDGKFVRADAEKITAIVAVPPLSKNNNFPTKEKISYTAKEISISFVVDTVEKIAFDFKVSKADTDITTMVDSFFSNAKLDKLPIDVQNAWKVGETPPTVGQTISYKKDANNNFDALINELNLGEPTFEITTIPALGDLGDGKLKADNIIKYKVKLGNQFEKEFEYTVVATIVLPRVNG